ncbi:MAG TPA: GGDEF domain-containing protein [Candidatus Baltobacteraceae bacterium]|nr:GGDEF domain-containing protein [Candidatus Baltobacteraceae bacterium]
MTERRAAAPSRAITVGGGIAAVAGLAAALTLYAASFTRLDWAVTALAAAAIAFVALHALPVRGLRMRRTGIFAEAIVLDLPIAAPLLALGGAVGITACALAFALGFGIAALVRRGEAVADLPRAGVLRVLASLLALPFAANIAALQARPLSQSTPIFVGLICATVVVFTFAISAPSAAYTFHLSVRRIWRRLVRDRRAWGVAAASILWTTVVRNEVLLGHLLVVIAMWLPVCLCARLLRTIDGQHAELHRLRLVRDAVQAMLGERDPLPQINAILATLRVPSFDETVCVMAATATRTENWRTVTTLGPPLSPAGDELGRRVLARLKFGGAPSTSLRDDYYIAYAFSARLSDGELHGAIAVFRRHDRPLLHEQIAQFTNAAIELAPLLRDMRTIAATQSAATIDGLTGLVNRATVMDRLAAMVDDLSVSELGAVLLLDIDHFKTINDELGHAAGDACLRKIGEIIRSGVRSGDTAGRIGGEEFLIVMPGADREVALAVGERLRLAVALGGMRHAAGDPVTTSIGVTAARVGDTAETMLARADRGLYEAKRQGRNRMVEDLESA